MTYRKRVEKRLSKKEKAYETSQLMKEKRSEEYEVLEEVFDRSTLMIIYGFLNKGIIDEIHGVVKAGKESRIYWGRDSERRELAIKIYLVVSAEFRKGMWKYIDGDPRFKGVKRDTRSLIFAWALKEFKNLELAHYANVRVPKPIAVRNNVLIMEFIGENGETAPSLKESPPEKPDKTYRELLKYLKRLYRKAELVHGDLSEYNVMVWKDETVLFDMAQAVPIVHPMAEFLLRRDFTNLNNYFRRLDVEVVPVDDLYRMVTGRGER